MKVKRLKLTNFRAIESAELRFQPGVNLIVGVNGVGKTSVLDALRIGMSRILPSITKSRAKALSFSPDDVRSGSTFADVELLFDIEGHEFRFTRQQWRQSVAIDDVESVKTLRREILDSDRLRKRPRTLLRQLSAAQSVSDQDTFSPSLADLRRTAGKSRGAPNCIYFSTNRSISSFITAPTAKSAGEEAVAYTDGLVPRPLYLAQFANWMRVQEVLSSESKLGTKHLEVLRSAARRFLPGYRNLRPESQGAARLLIDHGRITLDVAQLSDGERGVLALILELARRLSQANPRLDDPLRAGEAIVLIDEIDLHLHPKWQWTIVDHLSKVFPRCQFIATTHSPQVVAAVEPEQVLLLTKDDVIHPDRSFGMDSNWILRHLMEDEERPSRAARAIKTIEALIREGKFKKAFAAIAKERNSGLDLPEWSVLEARIVRLERLR